LGSAGLCPCFARRAWAGARCHGGRHAPRLLLGLQSAPSRRRPMIRRAVGRGVVRPRGCLPVRRSATHWVC